MNNDSRGQIRRPDVPLTFHILAFATLMTAALTVNTVVNSSAFVISSCGVALVGHGSSIFMRGRQKTSRWIEIVIFAVCMVIYMRVMLTPYELTAIHPMTSNSPQIKFAQLLIWIECLRAFTMVSAEAALFTGVTSVASIGLIATDNLDPEIMAYFVFYLLFQVALLTRYASMAGRRTKVSEEHPLNLDYLRLPVIVTVVTVALGVVFTGPARLVSTAVLGKAVPRLPGEGVVRLPGVAFSSASMPVMQGPAFLSEREVFSVRCKQACYWRGAVYSTYSGTVWDNGGEMQKMVAAPKTTGTRDKLEQIFTLRSGFYTTTLYGAAEPMSVTPEKTLRSRYYADQWNCWSTTKIQPAGLRYRVVSMLPERNPSKLAQAGTRYTEEIARKYLQTRSLVKDNPVRRLALKVTKDCDNPYEKAVAIESYLAREYKYDLSPPRAPQGTDVVEFFLFDSRSGYCTAFASAMAIMLREIGIPSRIAKGFAPGYYNPRRGVYCVVEKDLHAWVEVYFPKCGWVTFDPTDGGSEGQQTFWSILASETQERSTGYSEIDLGCRSVSWSSYRLPVWAGLKSPPHGSDSDVDPG